MADVRVYDVEMAVQGEVLDLDMHTSEAYDLGLSTAVGKADAKSYDGPYEVTPLAHDSVILETKDKLMADDVTVRKVPYYETSNLFDGQTAYIAEEI